MLWRAGVVSVFLEYRRFGMLGRDELMTVEPTDVALKSTLNETTVGSTLVSKAV